MARKLGFMPCLAYVIRGATLAELLTAITVLATLSLMVTPNLRDLMRRTRIDAAAQRLAADLSYARMTAVHRGGYASLCPSKDGSACNADMHDRGRIVYAYDAGKGLAAKPFDGSGDAGDVLLRHTQLAPYVSIIASSPNVLGFDPHGHLIGNTTQTFLVCFRGSNGERMNSGRVPGRRLRISPSGNVVMEVLAPDDDCV
jgi:type IV fimbrial biogenesis protein FimT